MQSGNSWGCPQRRLDLPALSQPAANDVKVFGFALRDVLARARIPPLQFVLGLHQRRHRRDSRSCSRPTHLIAEALGLQALFSDTRNVTISL